MVSKILIFGFVAMCMLTWVRSDDSNRERRSIIVDKIKDKFGYKCMSDSDCHPSECCAKVLVIGLRCRPKLREGRVCGTKTESVIKPFHERCPCLDGLSCQFSYALGPLTINKCAK